MKSIPAVWVPKGKRPIERVVHLVFSSIAEWDEVAEKRKITAPAMEVMQLAQELRRLADLIEREVG